MIYAKYVFGADSTQIMADSVGSRPAPRGDRNAMGGGEYRAFLIGRFGANNQEPGWPVMSYSVYWLNPREQSRRSDKNRIPGSFHPDTSETYRTITSPFRESLSISVSL
jgi:hypothetical protein